MEMISLPMLQPKNLPDQRKQLNSLMSGWFREFLKKKHLNARGFVREYLSSCSGYRPGRSIKRRGKSSSLHKFFSWGCEFF